MTLLIDIGNTNTHLGIANSRRVLKTGDLPTVELFGAGAKARVRALVGTARLDGICLCSVVPAATPLAAALLPVPVLELSPRTLRGVGIDYPRPGTIGPDRLANAVAVRRHFGAPAVVVDFGTAVTFDVVDGRGSYIGGIIAPGLSAMTDYLHEKTALLPRVRIREVRGAVGKSTQQAMLIGAVHGYRGLVRELIRELKTELKTRQLPVVATGGCARLLSAKLPEITAVRPDLTLEGLRLVWQAHQADSSAVPGRRAG